MGRKAKLKKLRHSTQPASTSQIQADSDEVIADRATCGRENDDSTQFVQHLEQQGYSLGKIMRSPEVPQQRTQPQV